MVFFSVVVYLIYSSLKLQTHEFARLLHHHIMCFFCHFTITYFLSESIKAVKQLREASLSAAESMCVRVCLHRQGKTRQEDGSAPVGLRCLFNNSPGVGLGPACSLSQSFKETEIRRVGQLINPSSRPQSDCRPELGCLLKSGRIKRLLQFLSDSRLAPQWFNDVGWSHQNLSHCVNQRLYH